FIQMDQAIAIVLDADLLELTRLRIATNNECKFCKNIILHEIDTKKRNSIISKNEISGLSIRENLALELVDKIMAYHGNISDEFFEELKKHFTSEEIIALLFHIGHKNTGGWFNIAMLIE